MHFSEFNDKYWEILLKNIEKENKLIVLIGGFSTAGLKYKSSKEYGSFRNCLDAFFVLPYTLSPSRATTKYRTVLDNIFSNNIDEENHPGNIISISILDHSLKVLKLFV